MFRSARRYLDELGIAELTVCYQGAVVAEPATGEFLVHERIELELARELVAFLEGAGFSPNVYVDDEMFVSQHTERSRSYASFQQLPVAEVGDLVSWMTAPPTKLVAVGDPAAIAELRREATAVARDRLFVTTSLPYFLEFGKAGVSKGTGLAHACGRLGIPLDRVVAFGDGENDVELLETAGFGVAVAGGHPRLAPVAGATCPPPEEDGVARFIDAYLDR